MDQAIEPITNNFIHWCVNGKNILKICFTAGIRNIKIIKQVSKERQLEEYSNRYQSAYFLSLRVFNFIYPRELSKPEIVRHEVDDAFSTRKFETVR